MFKHPRQWLVPRVLSLGPMILFHVSEVSATHLCHFSTCQKSAACSLVPVVGQPKAVLTLFLLIRTRVERSDITDQSFQDTLFMANNEFACAAHSHLRTNNEVCACVQGPYPDTGTSMPKGEQIR